MASSFCALIVSFVGTVKRMRMSTNKRQTSEEAARLAALAELPDPNGELCSQQLTFTCFPDLPPEVRLMIWRWTFPRGRRIDISQPLPPKPSELQQFIENFDRDSTYLPIMKVNKEGRCLVFDHYFVVFMTGALPFCFNPELDTAYLPATNSSGRIIHQDSRIWLDMLKESRPDLFEKIDTLEIRGWCWNTSMQMLVSDVIWKILNTNHAYGTEGNLLSCLPHIPSLSTIKFDIGPDDIDDTGMVDMLKWIALMLVLQAEEGTWKGKVPEVEVGWARIDWDSFVARFS